MREEQRAERQLTSGPWDVQWANKQDKKYINVYPFWDLIPSHLCGRWLLYPLCYRSNRCTYFTTAQDITLITHHNRPKQLCCCSVLCPGRAANVMSSSRTNETKTMNYLSDCFSLISPNSFFFFQKFAHISFVTDINIAENSIFLVRAFNMKLHMKL